MRIPDVNLYTASQLLSIDFLIMLSQTMFWYQSISLFRRDQISVARQEFIFRKGFMTNISLKHKPHKIFKNISNNFVENKIQLLVSSLVI